MKKLLLAFALVLLGPTAFAATVQGEVLEVRDAAPYTYLRLKTGTGETWAAVTAAPVKKGEQVTIANAMVMENFESKSLKKTFDKIVFGTWPTPTLRPPPAGPCRTAARAGLSSARPRRPRRRR